MRRTLLTGASSILLSLMVGLSAAQAQTAPNAAPPLRIGLILPISGGSADMGNSALTGAQVAVAEINQAGGYLGRPLQLVTRDDQSDNDLGRKHAQDLVLKEKVLATIGFCNTGVAMKSLDVFQDNKHVLIVPCATGTDITAKYPAEQSFIFRTSARDTLQSQFLVSEILNRGLTRVALLVDNTGYGEAGLRDLTAAMRKSGLKIQSVVRFDVGVKSLEEEMKRLKASGADALIGWTVGPEQGVIAASRVAVGWKVPHFGPWALSNASAYQTSGGKVDGALMVQTVLPNLYLERNSTFLREYAKLKKESPIGSMMSAAQTYDAMHLLVRAMFDAKGNLTGPGLKTALENQGNPYRGVVTTYEHPFSGTDHDAISANMLWLGTWHNQERAYYYKEDEKRAAVLRRKM